MNASTVLLAVGILAIVFVVLFGRRIRASYGSLRPNGTVTRRFEAYDVKEDLIYYTSGPDDCPCAIIGIKRELALNSSVWEKREVPSETMKKLVTNMEAKVSQLGGVLHGFDILDSSGNYIGEWYSVPGIHTAIRMGKESSVRIQPPPSDVYERN
ncbi:MAG: hypothetical protein JW736_08330 [Deltaproteobacteria bacterium]|nr:hypothetical protein [Deltaproteobacteria bacterium]MBN2688145.1 hypothetical protein [Deltaproteobacteria bacterium]